MAGGQMEPTPVDVDKPRWDQSQFSGRLQHFARVTNPLLTFKSNKELDHASYLVSCARTGTVPARTTVQELYDAKVLYDSAFHPDSGEKQNIFGRMSFQMPGGMVLTGILMVYYRTFAQVFMAQWLNQSFNALVNYTNRNAKSKVTDKQILLAYVGATSGAVTVSVTLNSLVKRAPPIIRRWVPFIAVASANCINTPVMRQREVLEGMIVSDKEGNALGKSRRAAAKGIAQVVFSRVAMACPGMLMIPAIMLRLERKFPVLKRPLPSVAMQTLLCGVSLTFTVPIACSLFPQQSSLKFKQLEPKLQQEIRERSDHLPDKVYFNKGL